MNNNKEDESRVEESGNNKGELRRASRKWTKEGKKCRKVEQGEVEHLGELIRYKMIAHGKTAS